MPFKKNFAFSSFLLQKVKPLFLLTLLFTIITNVMYYVVPLVTKIVIDTFFYEKAYDRLGLYILLFGGTLLFSSLATRSERYLSMLQEERINESFRERFMRCFFAKDYDDYTIHNYGQVETIFNNNLSTINNSIYCIVESFIASPIGLLIGASFIYSITPVLGLFMLGEILLMFLAVKFAAERRVKRYKEQLSSEKEYFNQLEKTVNSFEHIRFNFLMPFTFKRLFYRSSSYREKNMAYFKVETAAQLAFDIIGLIFEILFILYFVLLVMKERATPGDYFAFIGMKSYFVGAFNGFSQLKLRYKELDVAVSDINKVVDLDLLMNNESEQKERNVEKIDSIALKNVVFSYDEKSSVYDLNYAFEKGKIYVLFGDNGIGKTTLIRLLSGLCQPEVGDVLMNHKYKLRDIDENTLFRKMKVLTQKPILYDDTLLHNLAPEEPSVESFNEKFQELYAYFDFENILSLYDQGLDSNIFEDGKVLSGGQRKRVALLSMLYHNPDVLIFDEPFSELDHRMKKKFYSYLKEIHSDKIILIISHDHSWNWTTNEIFLSLERSPDGKVQLRERNEIE